MDFQRFAKSNPHSETDSDSAKQEFVIEQPSDDPLALLLSNDLASAAYVAVRSCGANPLAELPVCVCVCVYVCVISCVWVAMCSRCEYARRTWILMLRVYEHPDHAAHQGPLLAALFC